VSTDEAGGDGGDGASVATAFVLAAVAVAAAVVTLLWFRRRKGESEEISPPPAELAGVTVMHADFTDAGAGAGADDIYEACGVDCEAMTAPEDEFNVYEAIGDDTYDLAIARQEDDTYDLAMARQEDDTYDLAMARQEDSTYDLAMARHPSLVEVDV